jgi:hypothetical protein
MIDDDELIERLRQDGLLSDEQVAEARELRESEDRTLFEVLAAHRFVDEPHLVELLSEKLNVASVDPRDYEPDADILEVVPARVALDNWALPLEAEQADGNTRLVLAMRDPIDMFAMDEIADHVDVDIRPVLAGPRALHDALVDNYGEDGEIDLETPYDAASPGDAVAAQAPDSDSWPSLEEENPNQTHPGLVTSQVSEVEEESDAEADSAEQFDAPSPVPSEAEPGSDYPPTDSNRADEDDEQAIGRIPVKRVPASELEDESSEATLDEMSSEPAPAPSSSPDDDVSLGAFPDEAPEDNGAVELGGDPEATGDSDTSTSHEAFELGDASDQDDSADDSAIGLGGSSDDSAEHEAFELGGSPEENDSDDASEDVFELADDSANDDSDDASEDVFELADDSADDDSGDALELDGPADGGESVDSPLDLDGKDAPSPADADSDRDDQLDLDGEPPPPEAHDSQTGSDSQIGDDAESGDEESSLTALKKKLRGGSDDSEPDLVDRLLHIGDAVDSDVEQCLRDADRDQLLEAALLVLVERDIVSLEDIATDLGD